MYDTVANIAKYLFNLGEVWGQYGGPTGSVSKKDLYIGELSVFAKDKIDALENCSYCHWELKDESTLIIFFRKIDYSTGQELPELFQEVTLPHEVTPPSACESFQYNTPDDLLKYSVGDTITLAFQDKHYVKKEYRGGVLQFKVVGARVHYWGKKMKRLALVPARLGDKYEASDILYLDDTYRFKCLMIDLFGCNRIGYRGWRSKLVRIGGPDRKRYNFKVPE